MAAIAERTEADINYFGRMRNMTPDIRLGIGGATAHAACTTATDTNASAIITVTKSGATPGSSAGSGRRPPSLPASWMNRCSGSSPSPGG